jgi:hypothetical protein
MQSEATVTGDAESQRQRDSDVAVGAPSTDGPGDVAVLGTPLALPVLEEGEHGICTQVDFDIRSESGDRFHITIHEPLAGQWWSVTPDMTLAIRGRTKQGYPNRIVAVRIELVHPE